MHLEMKITPTRHLAETLNEVPEAPGLYAFWLPLRTWPESWAPARITICQHDPMGALYFGATADSLQIRLKSHLRSDSQSSSFRMSLGLLLAEDLKLKVRPLRPKRYFWFDGEERLTAWLHANTSAGCAVTSAGFAIEKQINALGGGLLNLSGTPSTPWAEQLRLDRHVLTIQPISACCGPD